MYPGKIFMTSFQVVANYFGVNGSFQPLSAFKYDHFTLQGIQRTHAEISDASCKSIPHSDSLVNVYFYVCNVLWSIIIVLLTRWARSVSFDWSHSGSCSGNRNAYSILFFQVITVKHVVMPRQTIQTALQGPLQK